MIVKAEIQSIDYNSNTCSLRMPTFESAAGGDKAIAIATFSTAPGIYNGYKENDVVLVAFENGQLQNPVVIGKLYLGAAEESRIARGTVNCATLNTTVNTTLPLTTKIESDPIEKTANVQLAATTYKTLKDILDTISNNTYNIKTINSTLTDAVTYSETETIIGTWIDKKPIYRKVFKYTNPIAADASILIGNLGATIDTVINISNIMRNSTAPYWWTNNYNTETVGNKNFCTTVHTDGKVYFTSWNESWGSPCLVVTVEYTKA